MASGRDTVVARDFEYSAVNRRHLAGHERRVTVIRTAVDSAGRHAHQCASSLVKYCLSVELYK